MSLGPEIPQLDFPVVGKVKEEHQFDHTKDHQFPDSIIKGIKSLLHAKLVYKEYELDQDYYFYPRHSREIKFDGGGEQIFAKLLELFGKRKNVGWNGYVVRTLAKPYLFGLVGEPKAFFFSYIHIFDKTKIDPTHGPTPILTIAIKIVEK